MSVQGQLGQPQQAPVLIGVPAPSQQIRVVGLLGNERMQVPTQWVSSDSQAFFALHGNLIASAQPAFKLTLLKRQKFTADGRQKRIAASLAAVNAPQPTDLTLTQWREIAEEVEDED